jgi:hypothetical protein
MAQSPNGRYLVPLHVLFHVHLSIFPSSDNIPLPGGKKASGRYTMQAPAAGRSLLAMAAETQKETGKEEL